MPRPCAPAGVLTPPGPPRVTSQQGVRTLVFSQEMIDETTPLEKAGNYKHQANLQLQVYLDPKKGRNKFYVREAIDLYSKALAEPGWDDPKLKGTILSNRAQCQIYLGEAPLGAPIPRSRHLWPQAPSPWAAPPAQPLSPSLAICLAQRIGAKR